KIKDLPVLRTPARHELTPGATQSGKPKLAPFSNPLLPGDNHPDASLKCGTTICQPVIAPLAQNFCALRARPSFSNIQEPLINPPIRVRYCACGCVTILERRVISVKT